MLYDYEGIAQGKENTTLLNSYNCRSLRTTTLFTHYNLMSDSETTDSVSDVVLTCPNLKKMICLAI